MINTPARMGSSPTHDSMNGIGNANTIVVTDQIPILSNFHSYDLRHFIKFITSRAVDNNTACNRNLITLEILIDPIKLSVDGTPITLE